MARHIASVCDWCDLHGIEDVPAVRSRTLGLDGPPRRIDVCRRCDVALADLEALYDRGQELPGEPARRSRGGGHAAPAGRAGSSTPAAGGDAETEPADETEPGRERAYVVCPLSHPSTGGRPLRVAYANRGNHADMVHHGAKIWEIAWEDPDGVLTTPCTAHQECIDNNLRFTTRRGATAHINACPLPRIDQDTGDGVPEGAG